MDAKTLPTREFRPQKGPQEEFLSTSADICIYGGAAGGGKSFALLLEPLRHINNKDFGAVIFRRTSPQIRNEGALWDTSTQLYTYVQGRPRESLLEWVFPSGATVSFAHLEHEDDRFDWGGAQIALLCFDELVTFTEKQFWFMLSRNRSTCGVRPYVRATTNPDPDSWVATLISWWIDQDTGYAIPERGGVIRWLLRLGDTINWFGSYREAKEFLATKGDAETEPKSFTFIPASIYDNKILLEKDPGYLANLNALPLVEREQLKQGNWKIRPEAGKIFNRAWFKYWDDALPQFIAQVRYWDKAGTEGAGKWSAGVKMGKTQFNQFIVTDVERGQWAALKREETILNTANKDGARVDVWHEQEPGSGGKESAESTTRNLAGFPVHADRVTGAKTVRARPYSAQVQAGNVFLVRGPWNAEFMDEHHKFGPEADDGKLVCDQVDAASGAFNKLTAKQTAGTW